MNLADEGTVGGEDVHAVEAVRAPAGCGPDIAVHIAPNAVGSARRHVRKHAPVRQPHAIYNVIHPNRARVGWVLWSSAIHYVKQFLVGREAETVRLIHIAGKPFTSPAPGDPRRGSFEWFDSITNGCPRQEKAICALKGSVRYLRSTHPAIFQGQCGSLSMHELLAD